MKFTIGGEKAGDDARVDKVIESAESIPDGELLRTMEFDRISSVNKDARRMVQTNSKLDPYNVYTYYVNENGRGSHSRLWGNAKTIKAWREAHPEWVKS